MSNDQSYGRTGWAGILEFVVDGDQVEEVDAARWEDGTLQKVTLEEADRVDNKDGSDFERVGLCGMHEWEEGVGQQAEYEFVIEIFANPSGEWFGKDRIDSFEVSDDGE